MNCGRLLKSARISCSAHYIYISRILLIQRDSPIVGNRSSCSNEHTYVRVKAINTWLLLLLSNDNCVFKQMMSIKEFKAFEVTISISKWSKEKTIANVTTICLLLLWPLLLFFLDFTTTETAQQMNSLNSILFNSFFICRPWDLPSTSHSMCTVYMSTFSCKECVCKRSKASQTQRFAKKCHHKKLISRLNRYNRAKSVNRARS